MENQNRNQHPYYTANQREDELLNKDLWNDPIHINVSSENDDMWDTEEEEFKHNLDTQFPLSGGEHNRNL